LQHGYNIYSDPKIVHVAVRDFTSRLLNMTNIKWKMPHNLRKNKEIGVLEEEKFANVKTILICVNL